MIKYSPSELSKKHVIFPGFAGGANFLSFFPMSMKKKDDSKLVDDLIYYFDSRKFWMYSFHFDKWFPEEPADRESVPLSRYKTYCKEIHKEDLEATALTSSAAPALFKAERTQEKWNLFYKNEEIHRLDQTEKVADLSVEEFKEMVVSILKDTNWDPILTKIKLIPEFMSYVDQTKNVEPISIPIDEENTNQIVNDDSNNINEHDESTKPDEQDPLTSIRSEFVNTSLRRSTPSYISQLRTNYTSNNEQYKLATCFNAVVALITNTIIYNDLDLEHVEAFENSIDWEVNAKEMKKKDISKPFITHINLAKKLIIYAFINDNTQDYDSIRKIVDQFRIMNKHVSEYGYDYKIITNAPNSDLMEFMEDLHLERQIEFITEKDIDTCYQIYNNAVLNNVFQLNKSEEASTTFELQLRDYQLKYIEYMDQNQDAILKLPCGMGKSLIMIYHMWKHRINDDETPSNVLILVPNIALVEQFKTNIERYYTELKTDIPELHLLSSKNKDGDQYIIHDPTKQQIIIAVYNSFILNIYNVNPSSESPETIKSIQQYDYVYVDEAHHVYLPSNKKQQAELQKLINQRDKDFSSDDEFITTLDNSRIGNSNSEIFKSVSAKIYGFCFFQNRAINKYFFSATIEPSNFSMFNMFSAIKAGYLCRLNVNFIIDESCTSINRKDKKSEIDRKIESLYQYIAKSSHQSIIVYTSKCDTARKISDKLNDNNINSVVITAKNKSSDRQKWFNDFRNHEIRCIITVNCISEGVDLPNADTAIFFDDKQSIINIIQCVGRVMRLCEGKLSSSLVVFGYSDDDVKELYKNILSVINGELGYDYVNLRRITTFNYIVDPNDPNVKKIRKNVNAKIIDYETEFFEKNITSIQDKINKCREYALCEKKIPSLSDPFQETKLPNGSRFSIAQFVNDNISLNNYAGRELRAIFNVSTPH